MWIVAAPYSPLQPYFPLFENFSDAFTKVVGVTG